MKPSPVVSLVGALVIAALVVGCTPNFYLVRATGRADVVSANQTFSVRFWLPPGLFGDWDETTVHLSVTSGLGARNTALPDDLGPSDADLTFLLGAPFDEEIRIRGHQFEKSLKWSTTDCALGCMLEVPIEIGSNVVLPDGVAWNTRWTITIAYPDPQRNGDVLGSHGWVVDGDGSTPNSWTATGPEELELDAGETVTRLVTLSVPDGASTHSNPIVLVSLSPSEIQALEDWVPVQMRVDGTPMGDADISSDSDWLTVSLPGVVERDSLHARWQLAETQCFACARQFAISFRSDRATAFWWIPVLQFVPIGSQLSISSP